jgi:hypothetical protein
VLRLPLRRPWQRTARHYKSAFRTPPTPKVPKVRLSNEPPLTLRALAAEFFLSFVGAYPTSRTRWAMYPVKSDSMRKPIRVIRAGASAHSRDGVQNEFHELHQKLALPLNDTLTAIY